MAIDKDKIAKEALKHIQRGQFQKAIDEYRKVLATDPRDIRTRLKLVDLYSRAGKSKEAIEECLQVAESYADQGFYLKSIAVYKQALRIDPGSPRLYRSMGELYVKQGLIGDGLAAFKSAVELLRQGGLAEEAEEVLGRMEEMAPDNVAIKIHLAELYLADGRMAAFETALNRIVLQLKGEGRARKLLQTVEGFYEKSRRDLTVLKRLAELHEDLNEDARALEVVCEGLAAHPGDRDLRLLALRAYLALGNLAEARRMALGLCEEDPDDLFILEQLAAIGQARGERGELSGAYRALAQAYGRKSLPLREEEYYRKVLELVPNDAEARLALGEMEEPSDEEDLLEADVIEIDGFWDDEAGVEQADGRVQEGLTEADLYLKYGMEEKAEEKLGELLRIAPDDVEILKKLRDLHQRRGNRDGWIREQLHIAGIYLQRHAENEALRAYQAIIDVAPDHAEAWSAIHRLKPEVAPARAFVGISIDVGPATEGDGHVSLEPGSGLREGADRPGGTTPDASDGFVDLQAEILDSSGAFLSADTTGFQDFEITELDDIVREFKSGIAEKLEEGDYETHYDLGTAYREMGLLDDALQEFQLAARSPERGREAYASMAMIFRETGRLDDARSALRMALAMVANRPEDQAAILCELGAIAREAGDTQGALQAYERARSAVPGFRDSDRQIAALRGKS